MPESRLDGRSILILEDEYLIAMDVEQSCLERGAREVTILRSLEQLRGRASEQDRFDAAILDLRLGGESTVHFARELVARGVPFVFATGMTDVGELTDSFPDVPVIGKPYSGDELVRILAGVIERTRSSCSA
ncbi:response regulator [Aquibium microcysteis]|uniref:response regulator n=1 Tax=Aquibium microcysteis TaxID=675281 RepID=UPI001EF36294|nr:response regulator [Aquibium microcysteis]